MHGADHLVAVAQPNEGERLGQAKREFELARLAERHRCGAVDNDRDWQLPGLVVAANMELAEPCPDLEIEMPYVVAGLIGPVVRELESDPPGLRPSLADPA